MTIMEWIKQNAKEGANLAEVEELVQKSTLEGITAKEQVIDLISKNPAFTGAFDSMVSTAVANHDKKYEETKLPELIKQAQTEAREATIKELNPEETPEQKEIREMREIINADRKDKAYNELTGRIRGKASEIGADPIWAEKYATFGEDGLDIMAKDFKYWQDVVETQIKDRAKGVLAGTPPQGGQPSKGMSLEEIAKLPTRAERTKARIEAGYN